ncbi:MAG: diguanylate cyclase, partial [Fimbriimonadaceae bacterium]|nr:diguanylate cyclase [Alphaproteobacteria bacterium]
RYGGEEFAFIMPNTWLDTSIKAVERIRKALSAKELKRSSGEKLGFITISTGISVLRSEDMPENLVARADRCLYEAKHSGRNRIVSEAGDGVAGDNAADENAAENLKPVKIA